MKRPSFLIVDTYYPSFLNSFYSKNKYLIGKEYNEQIHAIMSEFFGTADFYSKNLRKLGCRAEEVIANSEIIQKQWARERDLKYTSLPLPKISYKLPCIGPMIKNNTWVYQILKAQIKEFQPDILYIQDLNFLSPTFLNNIKREVGLIAGQIASPAPPQNYIKSYDIIFTSFPHFVERFRKLGVKSEYLKIGFEKSILNKVKPSQKRSHNISFVGSIGGILSVHKGGTTTFEDLAKEVPVNIWGYGAKKLAQSSPLKQYYKGEAWGKELYHIYGQSKIVINRHSAASENYANNMRLYEATGMGAMLITDLKDNLNELFNLGVEIESYKNSSELIEKEKYYLSHNKEREKIAKAGQKRTLKEHNYEKIVTNILNYVKSCKI